MQGEAQHLPIDSEGELGADDAILDHTGEEPGMNRINGAQHLANGGAVNLDLVRATAEIPQQRRNDDKRHYASNMRVGWSVREKGLRTSPRFSSVTAPNNA